MESFFLNGCGNPRCFFVFLNQFRFDVGHLYEPAIECSVNQGGLGAPAERIAMLNGAGVNHASSLLQIGHNLFVSIFDVLTYIVGDFLSKLAIRVNRNDGFSRLN